MNTRIILITALAMLLPFSAMAKPKRAKVQNIGAIDTGHGRSQKLGMSSRTKKPAYQMIHISKFKSIVVLPKDMSPRQLHHWLIAKGLQSADPISDCWRPKVDLGSLKTQVLKRMKVPVVWSGFNFNENVWQARQRDKYTKRLKDPHLARRSMGVVDIWTPTACPPRGQAMPSRGIDEEDLPAIFLAGTGIAVKRYFTRGFGPR